MRSISRKWTAVMAVVVFAGFAGGALAGASKLKGRITADGSSTVGPYTTSAAEGFQRKHSGVQVTVGISGTGGGFERFCNGEIDLANASRPIKSAEYAKCREKGIKWVAFTVANDGIAIVVNKQNTWANCLTVDQLKKIWAPGSKVDNWKDVDASFPDVRLKLYGPGTDSGTFDFFTEKINGKSKSSRSDYSATENDNIAVQGVTGERGGLAYFGLSYFEANQGKLNLVKVNDGKGCIAPTKKTVQNSTYRPLSRPLFIYSKRTSFRRPEVRSFIGYILNNERAIATKSRFVSLTDAQLRNSRSHYRQALKQVK